jgi:hypothetical protein
MKLKGLKEHYQNSNTGNPKIWKPKTPFYSINNAIRSGFDLTHWHVYKCTICAKFHVADKNKKDYK